MAEWQNIASAPKDGTFIILAASGPECGIVIAAWETSCFEDGWWMCDDGKRAIDLPLRGAEPTHWLPLPTPPETTA